MNVTVLKFDSLDSTNTEALKQARSGAPEGLCVVARQQTAGRGRHGRTWVSEKDAGLYFSIVIRPKIETRSLPLLTLVTGVAVYDTLVALGLTPDIKWVNDIHVGEKKLAGILAETTDTPFGIAVVIGIGINIRSSNYPAEIADIATSIESETGKRVSVDSLTPVLTDQLLRCLSLVHDPVKLIDEWGRRSTYAKGKRVRVKTGRETITGTTEGLEPNGALRVRTDEDEVQVVQAGEVERLRSDIN